MGITGFSLNMIRKYGGELSGIRHLLVGCQNLYDNDHYGEIAEGYYQSLGQDVISIDIIGCNNSIVHDLREPLPMNPFDFISQHGTLEHVESRKGFYLSFKHLHDALKTEGIIIHENPKTGNWPGHGNHYLVMDFYTQLASISGYDILTIGEHFAMGNTTDGCNIYCVMKKTEDVPFISEDKFNELPIYDK